MSVRHLQPLFIPKVLTQLGTTQTCHNGYRSLIQRVTGPKSVEWHFHVHHGQKFSCSFMYYALTRQFYHYNYLYIIKPRCWAHGWAVQKWLNWSRYPFGSWLVGPRNHVVHPWQEGALFR